jgi:hypothetical protein
LKDDATFALFIAIFPHMVTMFNKIDNILTFDTILNGEPIGLRNHDNPQNGINIAENNNRGDNKL